MSEPADVTAKPEMRSRSRDKGAKVTAENVNVLTEPESFSIDHPIWTFYSCNTDAFNVSLSPSPSLFMKVV